MKVCFSLENIGKIRYSMYCSASLAYEMADATKHMGKYNMQIVRRYLMYVN